MAGLKLSSRGDMWRTSGTVWMGDGSKVRVPRTSLGVNGARTGGNRDVAHTKMAAMEAEVRSGEWGRRTLSGMSGGFAAMTEPTLTDVSKGFLFYRKQEGETWAAGHESLARRLDLLPEFGKMKLADMRAVDMERFARTPTLAGCVELSGSSAQTYATLLKAQINQCVKVFKWEVRDNWKCGNLKEPQQDRKDYCTREELREVLGNLDTFWRPICEFLFLTGARPSEATRLRMRDINLEQRTAQVHHFKGGPRNAPRPRYLHLPERLLVHLRALDKKPNQHVFESKDGRCMAPSLRPVDVDVAVLGHDGVPSCKRRKCDYPFTKALKKAGVEAKVRNEAHLGGRKAFSPYWCRHTFGTLQSEMGTDVVTISRMMGHADLKMTLRYVKTTPETVRAAVAGMSAWSDAPTAESL